MLEIKVPHLLALNVYLIAIWLIIEHFKQIVQQQEVLIDMNKLARIIP